MRGGTWVWKKAVVAPVKISSNATVSSAKWTFQRIRNNTTRILAGTTILLAMGVVGLSLGWAIDHNAHKNRETSFCLSGECSDAASQIFKNLAPNYTDIDPCTDFEQYACGGFQKHHKLRPDQSSLFTLTIMAEDNQQTLRQVLEKSPSDIKTKDRANFKKLKADYDACMDEKTIQNYGLVPLKELTEHVKGKCPEEHQLRPVRNSMSQLNIRREIKDITEAIIYMTSIGVENVMQLYVAVSLSPLLLLITTHEVAGR